MNGEVQDAIRAHRTKVRDIASSPTYACPLCKIQRQHSGSPAACGQHHLGPGCLLVPDCECDLFGRARYQDCPYTNPCQVVLRQPAAGVPVGENT